MKPEDVVEEIKNHVNLEKETDIPPTIVMKKDGNVETEVFFIADDADKKKLERFLSRKKEKIDFSEDNWLGLVSCGYMSKETEVAPSDDPKAKEVFIIQAKTDEGEYGVVIDQRSLETIGVGELEGRLAI